MQRIYGWSAALIFGDIHTVKAGPKSWLYVGSDSNLTGVIKINEEPGDALSIPLL